MTLRLKKGISKCYRSTLFMGKDVRLLHKYMQIQPRSMCKDHCTLEELVSTGNPLVDILHLWVERKGYMRIVLQTVVSA